MEKVWLRAPHIKCVHPGWPLLVGWGSIMASWERIFDNTFSMRFTLKDVRVEASGELGWSCSSKSLNRRAMMDHHAPRFSRPISSKNKGGNGSSCTIMRPQFSPRLPWGKITCSSRLAASTT